MPLQLRRPELVDYPAGATFGPRTLHDFEFVWILRGSAVWSCGERTETLLPGTFQLLRPGMRDHFRWDPDQITRHGFVHFTVEPTPSGTGRWPVIRQAVLDDDPLPALFSYLLWLGNAEQPGWHERAVDVLAASLRIFVDGPLPAETEAIPLPRAVESVAMYLRSVWADGRMRPVRLDDLASAATLSTVQLSRIFRQHFGIGPVGAVELLRLGRAESLLLRSNLSIAAIADLCGYPDPYHFSRRFRAAYGVAPRDFRAGGPSAVTMSPVAEAGLLPMDRLVRRPIRFLGG